MAKILIYRHRKSKGAVERKPGGQGVDFILAHGWDDLSGRLEKDTSFDLLILDSVPPKKKPGLIKRIMKIQDIPVVFFEEKSAGRDLTEALIPDIGRKLRKAEDPESARADDPMEAARRFMDDKFRTSLTLKQIASRAGISPSYFCRKFKLCYSQTPITYLISLRIARARYLLEHTSLPLSDVTVQSGFLSVSYFCREFKKAVGTSPSKYRRKNVSKTDKASKRAF